MNHYKISKDLESTENSIQVSKTESNISENQIDDSKKSCSRECEDESKIYDVNLFGAGYYFMYFLQVIILIFSLELFLRYLDLCGRLLKPIKQLLAAANYEEAFKKSVKVNAIFRKDAIKLVVKEYASAGRYDEALKIVSLMRNKKDSYYVSCISFIVEAKAANEQFDGLDELIKLIGKHSFYKHCAYNNVAISQAKAGLMDAAEKTLQQMKDAYSIKNAKIMIAKIIFNNGQIKEAIALARSIQITGNNFVDKINCLCNLADQSVRNDDIETAWQLLFESLDIYDKFAKHEWFGYLMLAIIGVLRHAGKPEEGLRFVREIADRYPNDEKNKNENQTTFSRNDCILYETAILNVEFGNYNEGWTMLLSIKSLFEYVTLEICTPRFGNMEWIKGNSLLVEFFKVSRKKGVDVEAEFRYVENIINQKIAALKKSNMLIDLLKNLFNIQVAAQFFDDAIKTLQQLNRFRILLLSSGRYYPEPIMYYWGRITAEQVRAGKIEDALKSAKNGIPKYIWKNIILAEAKADRFDDAVKYLFSQYYKSECEKLLSQVIKIRVDKGCLAESEKMLELYKSSDPTYKVDVLLLLSETYFELGDKDAADRFVSQAILLMNQCLNPSYLDPKPEQFLRISILLSKLGRFSDALKFAGRISVISVSRRESAFQAIADSQPFAERSPT
ncbi:MAG: hypothetical protein LBB88_02845 [Planctomycetaceae bacterium]|jgi:Tfp pilus assembly protein PilF|nr:hypothetical protein [Planctomycetaceae bacterium]